MNPETRLAEVAAALESVGLSFLVMGGMRRRFTESVAIPLIMTFTWGSRRDRLAIRNRAHRSSHRQAVANRFARLDPSLDTGGCCSPAVHHGHAGSRPSRQAGDSRGPSQSAPGQPLMVSEWRQGARAG